MIGDRSIDLIKLVIWIPFKPNFEIGTIRYMFVGKEFTPNFKIWPRTWPLVEAQEERIKGGSRVATLGGSKG